MQQLLLHQQEGRRVAGRSFADRGCGPTCLLPGSNGYEICTHLQFLSFHTGLLIYFQSTCSRLYTNPRPVRHMVALSVFLRAFVFVSKLYSCLQIAYNIESVHIAYTLLAYLVNEKESYRCKRRLPETISPTHIK